MLEGLIGVGKRVIDLRVLLNTLVMAIKTAKFMIQMKLIGHYGAIAHNKIE